MGYEERAGRKWAAGSGRDVLFWGGDSTLCGWGSEAGSGGSPQPSDLPDEVFSRLEGPFAFKTGSNAAFYHSAADAYADLGRAILALTR